MTTTLTPQTEQNTRTNQIQQVQELRQLCRLMMEQQESVLMAISEKLDALEIELTVAYAVEATKDVTAEAVAVEETTAYAAEGGVSNA